MSPVAHHAGAPSVLVLGGTTEGRTVADSLVRDGWAVTTSLAGRTSAPRLPAGQTRIGGFGGVAGLVGWLTTHRPLGVVDATHPYAARISAHAAAACAQVGVPLLRLARPAWADTHRDAARWLWAADHAAAAHHVLALLPDPAAGGSVLVTVGRQETPAYVEPLAAHPVIARVAEARDMVVPAGWRLLAQRGPFSVSAERELFADAAVRVLVSKDSGGEAAAKLAVAREFGAVVVMIRRPTAPDGSAHVVADPEAACRWCHDLPLGS